MNNPAAHIRVKRFIRGIVMATAFLFLSGTSDAETAGRVWIDTEPAVPYAFNKAAITGPDGLSAFARLYGVAADGTRTMLFEARFGRLGTLEALWYADPRFLWLDYEGRDGTGADIGASLRLGPRLPETDNAADTDVPVLAAQNFPYRVQPFRASPSEFVAADTAPGDMVRAAVSRLFAPARSVWPLAALSAWSLLSIGLVKRGRRDALAMAVFITGSALTAAAAATTGWDTAELYTLAVQDQGSVLVRSVQRHGAYDEVLWHAKTNYGDNGAGLRFLALRSPLSAAIPVSALAPYRRLRFAEPPVVSRRKDGAMVFAAASFSAVWGLHD